MCLEYGGIDLNMCCASRCGNVLNVTVSECVQNGGNVLVNMCCASRSSHVVQSQVETCPNKKMDTWHHQKHPRVVTKNSNMPYSHKPTWTNKKVTHGPTR
jgi:hypothetical protein